MSKVSKVNSREVLDSRGFPTVEVDVHLESGHWGRAIVPSGASTGTHEALELRDGDPKRYMGKGVLKAVDNVQKVLSSAVRGFDPADLWAFDQKMLSADGTANKTRLGANAILGVSLAAAKASASEQQRSLALWITDRCMDKGYKVTRSAPIPLMNVINGGAHADNGLDVQEFMIVPHGFSRFSDALRAGSEIFHTLKKKLSSQGLTTAVGDEGGFAPRLSSNREALTLLVDSIESAGYKTGQQVSLALDVAASEFFRDGQYHFKDKSLGTLSGEAVVDYYEALSRDFPLVSIEDGFAEDDWGSWSLATRRLGKKLQWVGDDLFVTQVSRLKRGIEEGVANAILIKLNQVGTLSETLDTMKLAADKGYRNIVSHRSGESEDATLAHLVVGTGVGQVKTGSLSRSDRTAKYNELLRLSESLELPFAKIF